MKRPYLQVNLGNRSQYHHTRAPRPRTSTLYKNFNKVLCIQGTRYEENLPEQIEVRFLAIDEKLLELYADLFSRHACPLERTIFCCCGGRRNKWEYRQQYLVPGNRYVYCKKQAGVFSQRRGSIVKLICFCIYVLFCFFFCGIVNVILVGWTKPHVD